MTMKKSERYSLARKIAERVWAMHKLDPRVTIQSLDLHDFTAEMYDVITRYVRKQV